MKLLKQILKKKMDLSNEFMLKRQYLRGIWQFYCVYNLALAILEKEDDEKIRKKRNKIWKRWLISNEFDEKKFKRFKKFMQEDMKIVVEALSYIEEESKKVEFELGGLDKPGMIGMLSYEFET